MASKSLLMEISSSSSISAGAAASSLAFRGLHLFLGDVPRPPPPFPSLCRPLVVLGLGNAGLACKGMGFAVIESIGFIDVLISPDCKEGCRDIR